MCDLAEVLWRKREEADDMLILLAHVAMGRRAGAYDLPSERLAAALAEAGPQAVPRGPERAAQITAALAAFGG